MNKIKHLWSILCLNSSVDSVTNNISLFSVLESMQIDKEAFKTNKSNPKKGAALQFQLVTLWYKENKSIYKFNQKIEIIDPTGLVLSQQEFPVEIPANINRSRHVITFLGMPLTVTGIYKFRITAQDFEHVVPLEVKST